MTNEEPIGHIDDDNDDDNDHHHKLGNILRFEANLRATSHKMT